MKGLILILAFLTSSISSASPIYYHFSGEVKANGFTDPNGIINAAGITIGSKVDVWWLVDFDNAGRYTKNDGSSGVTGDFYADFYLGDNLPLIWSNPDPLQIAEHNWGYSRTYASELIGGSGTDHNGMRAYEENPWDIGSIWEGYEYANDSDSNTTVYFFDAVLTEITSKDPNISVSEPSTLGLLGLAILSLVTARMTKLS